ncbi:hypothetical protein ACFXDJ_35200 [Streptomyces sp. NPDC059443]|uniref:hypothetical protein n=1 Tax=unclassified Streptomyces TaxID=2593676 RepID=UPI0036C359BD
MSAPTHTPAPRTIGADARLHWWTLAPAALAFALLLILLAGSGEAHADSGGGSALVQVTHQLLRAVG